MFTDCGGPMVQSRRIADGGVQQTVDSSADVVPLGGDGVTTFTFDGFALPVTERLPGAGLLAVRS